MIFLFGTRATKIDSKKVNGVTCPNCQSENTMTASKYGRYFHLFFIPIFPTSQRTILECSHCYKTFDGSALETKSSTGQTVEIIEKKRPLWHSCGCLLIILFITITSVTTCVGYFLNKDKSDVGEEAYNADFAKMTNNPNCEIDSVSCAVKRYMDVMLTDELDKKEFSYFSRVDGDKILILLKVNDMKKVKPSDRQQFLSFMVKGAKTLNNMEKKSFYLGVQGRWNLLLTYTPYTQNLGGRAANQKDLYTFYSNTNK